jgi:uncharacterized protein (DUF1697 family)
MTTFVALLRGINVGGRNILPMQDFRDLLVKLGCENVATYIQSGNAVFRHSCSAEELSESIPASIEAKFGFRPLLMLLGADEFSAIAAANPYRDETVEAKLVHVSFLTAPALKANLERMNSMASDGETFFLTESALYFYAPNGIGRSKLAGEMEKCLGVPATARNQRTVSKIGQMLAEID